MSAWKSSAASDLEPHHTISSDKFQSSLQHQYRTLFLLFLHEQDPQMFCGSCVPTMLQSTHLDLHLAHSSSCFFRIASIEQMHQLRLPTRYPLAYSIVPCLLSDFQAQQSLQRIFHFIDMIHADAFRLPVNSGKQKRIHVLQSRTQNTASANIGRNINFLSTGPLHQGIGSCTNLLLRLHIYTCRYLWLFPLRQNNRTFFDSTTVATSRCGAETSVSEIIGRFNSSRISFLIPEI